MKENIFTANKKIIIQLEGCDKSDRSEFEIIWNLKEIFRHFKSRWFLLENFQ